MPKVKPTISYIAYEIPARARWMVRIDLPRKDVANFCEGLRCLVSQRNGAVFYYPNTEQNTNSCRYEWHTRWQRKKFGVRLGIYFTVTAKNLTEVECYAAYGDGHSDHGKTPKFSEGEATNFNGEITTVINEALSWPTSEKKLHHVVYFMTTPPFSRIEKITAIEKFGTVVFPTVISGKRNERVSAVVFNTASVFVGQAKSEALRQHAILCCLLTLAHGSLFSWYSPEWPRNRKPTQLIDSVSPFPPLEKIYPHRRWRVCQDSVNQKFGERLQAILSLYYGLSSEDRSKLIDPLFAFYAGKEIIGKQPTLATVAFLAALSPLASSTKCEGDMACSICGELSRKGERSFRHNLVGERQALTRSIGRLFKLDSESDEYRNLDRLITRVYEKQRSAYVHGATLRHQEYNKGSALDGQPTEQLAYPGILLYQLDLHSLEATARRALLLLLAERAQGEIDDVLFNLSESFKPAEMPVSMSVSLSKSAMVRLALRPPQKEEKDSD